MKRIEDMTEEEMVRETEQLRAESEMHRVRNYKRNFRQKKLNCFYNNEPSHYSLNYPEVI